MQEDGLQERHQKVVMLLLQEEQIVAEWYSEHFQTLEKKIQMPYQWLEIQERQEHENYPCYSYYTHHLHHVQRLGGALLF
jgi:hypothetical protein